MKVFIPTKFINLTTCAVAFMSLTMCLSAAAMQQDEQGRRKSQEYRPGQIKHLLPPLPAQDQHVECDQGKPAGKLVEKGHEVPVQSDCGQGKPVGKFVEKGHDLPVQQADCGQGKPVGKFVEKSHCDVPAQHDQHDQHGVLPQRKLSRAEAQPCHDAQVQPHHAQGAADVHHGHARRNSGIHAGDDSSDSDASDDDGQLHCGFAGHKFAFVDEAQCNVSRLTAKNLKHVQAMNNSIIQGIKFGHRTFTGSLIGRTLQWQGSVLENVIMRKIKGGAMNGDHSRWNRFEVSGSIYDWGFQDARLENGIFAGVLEGVNFNKAYLKHVHFNGAKLSDAKRKGFKKTTFVNATLEDVSFDNTDLDDVSFADAIFTGRTSFNNARIDFHTCFKGAKIQLASGEFVLITSKIAKKLNAHYSVSRELSFVSNDFNNWISGL